MATQTTSTASLPVRLPFRWLRIRLARWIARRDATRALARAGITGRQARLLAAEMASRVRD